MDLVSTGWKPGATVYRGLQTSLEPWFQMGAPSMSVSQFIDSQVADGKGEVVFDTERGTEYILYEPGVNRAVHSMLGFTRQVPILDELIPDTMQSNSGDQVLEVHGRGLSISNELYFGAAGQGEPVRPKDQKIITTIIKTDLWAPNVQPVWVVNAGIKSNVLPFTFTA